MPACQTPHLRWLAVLAGPLMLAGCAQLRPDWENQKEASEQITGVDRHSTFPAVRRTAFEQVNLVEMIDPLGRTKAHSDASGKPTDAADKADPRNYGVRYDLALAWFRSTQEITKQDKQLQRNSVQDKMLAVSVSRCNVFKTFLRRQQSDVNFLLGSATTAAGVLGAVLPGATASRNLAGMAGLFSGTQAEYNSAYYSNLAAHVIVQGIELRQARLQKELVQSRRDLTIDAYSMEAAINDAIVMDGTCSTVVGLLEAADAIKESNNPGLARAAEVMAGVRVMNEIANAEKVSELAESGKLARMLRQSSIVSSPLVVASSRPNSGSASAQQVDLVLASQAQQRLAAERAAVLARAVVLYRQAQAKLAKADQAATDLAPTVSELLATAIDAAAKPLPVADCTAAVVRPGTELAEAQFGAQLAPKDEAARIKAALKLQTALANANAAGQRVQALVDWLSAEPDKALQAWAPRFGAAKLDAAALGLPVMAAAPDSLKTLCTAAPAT